METHRLREWLPGVGRKGCGEGIVRECGINVYTQIYLKWITHTALRYSTGNSAQCSVAAWMGGALGEIRCMYMTD